MISSEAPEVLFEHLCGAMFLAGIEHLREGLQILDFFPQG
jgi:hypothetical protein